MDLPPAPLELLFSTNAAKSLRVKTSAPASNQAGNFLQQWRIELMDNLMGSRAFVITNLSTLFTFIIPQEFPCTFDSITKTFLMRLRFSLLAASPPVEWKPSEVIPVRGNPRAVIGSMNDMISMVTFRREANNFDGTEAEDFLNRTPFSMIGMKRPKDRFMDQLQALSGHINR